MKSYSTNRFYIFNEYDYNFPALPAAKSTPVKHRNNEFYKILTKRRYNRVIYAKPPPPGLLVNLFPFSPSILNIQSLRYIRIIMPGFPNLREFLLFSRIFLPRKELLLTLVRWMSSATKYRILFLNYVFLVNFNIFLKTRPDKYGGCTRKFIHAKRIGLPPVAMWSLSKLSIWTLILFLFQLIFHLFYQLQCVPMNNHGYRRSLEDSMLAY